MFCENLEKHYDFNLLMDLLINSDDKLCLYFLEKIKDLYFEKDDFYKKRKNSKILLFEAFNDKCKNLFTKFGNSKGTYTFKVKKIIDSISYDLQNSNIKTIYPPYILIPLKSPLVIQKDYCLCSYIL